jgi:GNS1/SUR4 family
MAALNLYICLELLINSRKLGYDLLCEPVHDSNSYNEMRVSIVGCIPVKEISEKTRVPQIRRALWWFYFSKLLEFTDTFCFIVRKKDNQLTFLHVYHHSTMPTLWWIGVKWVPSGSSRNLKDHKIEKKNCHLYFFNLFYRFPTPYGQFIRSRPDVHLLRTGRFRIQNGQVLVVEEILDHHSVGKKKLCTDHQHALNYHNFSYKRFSSQWACALVPPVWSRVVTFRFGWIALQWVTWFHSYSCSDVFMSQLILMVTNVTRSSWKRKIWSIKLNESEIIERDFKEFKEFSWLLELKYAELCVIFMNKNM